MTTSTTGQPRRPARPPLTPVHRNQRPTFLSSRNPDPAHTRVETWAARSTDGLWSYERLDGIPGTPWEITYLPTGQNTLMGSLRDARAWTATPQALAYLHQMAADMLARLTDRGLKPTPDTEADIGRACRWLLILNGQMAPASPDAEPETTCQCGGLLICPGGQWRHIDACRECWNPSLGWQVPCHDRLAAHTGCFAIEPVPCDHASCLRPMALSGPPCQRELDVCCSCCHEEPES